MSDELSQADADHLLALQKLPKEQKSIIWPALGRKLALDLVSRDQTEEFVVNATRSYIKLEKLSLNARGRTIVVLARLEIEGSPHRNSDDVEMLCPHLHLYREGYGARWAFPVPTEIFTDLTNHIITFKEFLKYCNVTDLPQINSELFP